MGYIISKWHLKCYLGSFEQRIICEWSRESQEGMSTRWKVKFLSLHKEGSCKLGDAFATDFTIYTYKSKIFQYDHVYYNVLPSNEPFKRLTVLRYASV